METIQSVDLNTGTGFRYRERRLSENEKIMEHQSKLDFDNVPVPADLNELVSMLKEIFSSDLVNVEYVAKLIGNYRSNPKDWRQYAKYDPHRYENLLLSVFISLKKIRVQTIEIEKKTCRRYKTD